MPSDDADIIDENIDSANEAGVSTDEDRGSWWDALKEFLKDEKEDQEGPGEA